VEEDADRVVLPLQRDPSSNQRQRGPVEKEAKSAPGVCVFMIGSHSVQGLTTPGSRSVV